ncbi:sigma-70 family RNA polymerase sigma factor [Gluconacetobacter takamatsuzukensis]|uniref:Sigma-70 family RNA polymerase sigma factor n=1 Tax=Gluconacetobacter takamatsuzukensis TaxID=1286190 RepID=A0A7W4KC91_9PROT|nr:sigma-70 family RNA polymerase sigma factor [Gluconacetobacter takamatsuzukensis]MBB2204180.1 sigma-70 family RNA polymerase sigma factor [Gluconacetobacter takamatsuzukensis]
MPDAADATARFLAVRPDLIGIAYRMTGSLAVAEDLAQEAFLRWHAAARGTIDHPRAWLARVVTRLCLDWLRSSAHRYEHYVGPWLPEPVLDTQDAPQIRQHVWEQDLSMAFLSALQALSPAERAAFILHDLFEMPFDELAELLQRSEAACRQMASRARKHLRQPGPRHPMDREAGRKLTEAFLQASRLGDETALRTLLSQDVRFVSDGGGVRPAARKIIEGIGKVSRLLAGLARKRQYRAPPVLYQGLVNGEPGFVTLEEDGLPQVTTLSCYEGRVVAVYVVRNPGKLRGMLPG